MAKILLVEDDKSLREIYGVRLQAEGYEIVSAGDGEEALAMAIKEKPDLIVSDVMMPKISGFDMLDILRSTTETKNVKVIMMTALSSDDQRARGEALGADRYLVKSQVGIEDVVRTVHDVLADGIPAPAAAPSFTPVPPAPAPEAPAATPAPQPAAPAFDLTPAPAPVAPTPVADPFAAAPVPAPAPTPTPQPVTPAPEPVVTPQPVTPAPAPVLNEIPTPAPQPAAPAFDPTPAPAPVAPTPVADPFAAAQPAAPVPAPTPTPQPVTPVPEPTLPQPTAPFSSPAPASLGERVIQPLVDPNAAPSMPLDIASQMEQALGANPAPQGPGTPPVPPSL